MIFTINQKYRLKTEPLNWTIQRDVGKSWKSETFLDQLPQIFSHLKREAIPHPENLMEDIIRILDIQKYAPEFSVYDLTMAKHPEFSKKTHPNSLNNLKNKRFLSFKSMNDDVLRELIPHLLDTSIETS
jgi:hypothetical protein